MATVTAQAPLQGSIPLEEATLTAVSDALQSDVKAYRDYCATVGVDVFLEIEHWKPAVATGEVWVEGNLVLAIEPARGQGEKAAEELLQRDLWELVTDVLEELTLSNLVWNATFSPAQG